MKCAAQGGPGRGGGDSGRGLRGGEEELRRSCWLKLEPPSPAPCSSGAWSASRRRRLLKPIVDDRGRFLLEHKKKPNSSVSSRSERVRATSMVHNVLLLLKHLRLTQPRPPRASDGSRRASAHAQFRMRLDHSHPVARRTGCFATLATLTDARTRRSPVSQKTLPMAKAPSGP